MTPQERIEQPAAVARKIHQRRRQRRRQSLNAILARSFIAYLIIIGGATGILLGAIILNAIEPGHPIYLAIRDWLRGIFG